MEQGLAEGPWSLTDHGRRAEMKLKSNLYDLEAWSVLVREAQVLIGGRPPGNLSLYSLNFSLFLFTVTAVDHGYDTCPYAVRATRDAISYLWQILEALHRARGQCVCRSMFACYAVDALLMVISIMIHLPCMILSLP